MKFAKPVLLLAMLALTCVYGSSQTRQPSMTRWIGKYPDSRFFTQPQIKTPLRRILTKKDFDAIGDYNLMVPIKRVGDYLVAYSQIKYADPDESLSLAYGLKDNAVYVVFQKGEERRKFSTKNNEFNLPDDVLEELGLAHKE